MLFANLNRKIIALVTAVIVWFVVSQSITETKTIPNVPVRVQNLPQDKTIIGLLPNGYLGQRLSLTISGAKDVIQDLESGDLEVHLDAASLDTNTWVVAIAKKNIVSLNPNLDLRRYITSVTNPEFVLRLSNLVTKKIPIFVEKPKGTAPKGYEYLDVWPDHLMQTTTGPEEEINALQAKGLTLTLDLNLITKELLEQKKQQKRAQAGDEIAYLVPEKWKKILIPFKEKQFQEINDPEAQYLQIDFLKEQLNPLGKEIPISIYYPQSTLGTINPSTQKLLSSSVVRFSEGVALFTKALYVKGVSRLFLDIVRDHLEIIIVASHSNEQEALDWSLEVIDTKSVENAYAAYMIAHHKDHWSEASHIKDREAIFRHRFRQYIQKLVLCTENGEKLQLTNTSNTPDIQLQIKTGTF